MGKRSDLTDPMLSIFRSGFYALDMCRSSPQEDCECIEEDMGIQHFPCSVHKEPEGYLMPQMRKIVMKTTVIPSLTEPCQSEAIKRLCRNCQWVPAGYDLLSPNQVNHGMLVIVHGEAEALFAAHRSKFFCKYRPLLCAGGYAGESALVGPSAPSLWQFRSPGCYGKVLPEWLPCLLGEYLGRDGKRFRGRLVTISPSLVARLSRNELRALVQEHDAAGVEKLEQMQDIANSLQNRG